MADTPNKGLDVNNAFDGQPANGNKSNDAEFKPLPDSSQEVDYLKSIDAVLKKIAKTGGNVSQSEFKNKVGNKSDFKQQYESYNSNKAKQAANKKPKSFSEGFKQSIFDDLLGKDFKQNIQKGLNQFSKNIGMDLSDIPGQIGSKLGQQAMSSFKTTDLGKQVSKIFGNFSSDIASAFGQGGEAAATAEAVATSGEALAGFAGGVGSISELLAAAQPIISGIVSAGTSLLAAAWPLIVGIGAAILVVDALSDAVGPAVEGFKKFAEGASRAANRYEESRKKYLELEKTRIKEDTETLIKKPFEILQDAAQNLYDAWDNQIRLINQTQGYTKSDTQNLMSDFAKRLASEGLASTIPVTDIVNNLSTVLSNSGLSGAVAEEFAYQATKLMAEIPTQDFLGYASVYGQIGAAQIAAGKSQEEALKFANSQLQSFANSLVSASRQTGGFSTGLKDAQSLFESAVKVAQTSRSADASGIASTLTSVQAIIGAVAPDLASELVSSIVSAATGGNSSEIVALRAMAGINASNTEFLQALVKDPKSLIVSLFEGLGNIQHISDSAYMEVVEGLSSIFNLSMEDLARVDFNYLAQQIEAMNLDNDALTENVKLLQSGQSTTSTEQLKIAQINKLMIDEGLAYVLDNDAARAIQQHMWDEQLAQELQENEYGVQLVGGTLELLEGIKSTIDNIIDLINPFSWLKKAANLVATAQESAAKDADIRQLLELSKVGNGNIKELYQLTTRGKSLGVTDSLINMMGGFSAYQAVHQRLKAFNTLTNFRGASDLSQQVGSLLVAGVQNVLTSSLSNSIRYSKYSWGTLSKSDAAAIYNQGVASGNKHVASNTVSLSQIAASNVNRRVQEAVSGLSDYIKTNQGATYESWIADKFRGMSATDAGIAIENAGYKQSQVKEYFQQVETEQGAQLEQDHRQKEEQFWIDNITRLTSIDDVRLPALLEELQAFHQSFTSWVGNEDGKAAITWTSWVSEKYPNFWGPKYEKWDKFANINYPTYWLSTKKIAEEWYKDWYDKNLGNVTYLNAITKSNLLKTESKNILSNIKNVEGADPLFKSLTELTLNKASGKLSQKLSDIQSTQSNKNYEAIYELVNVLTKNSVDLLDPTVQTNTLLAQIVVLLNAMMQQNNKLGANTEMSTSLSDLALGLLTNKK